MAHQAKSVCHFKVNLLTFMCFGAEPNSVYWLRLFGGMHAGVIKENTSSKSHLTGYVMAQLVEALRYKPEGRGFDSR